MDSLPTRDDFSGERLVPEVGPVRTALAGKTVVLTGFTGFLGKVFVALLLEEVPDIGMVRIIVRRRARKEPAVRRLERIVETSPVFRHLRARHGDRLAEWLGARVEVLDGDVEKPWCELAPETMDALRGRTDLVIHCAGLTDFQPDPLEALAVNVAGAVHVADLAGRIGAKLMHISTAYVAGNIGSAEVSEALVAGRSPNGTAFSAPAELRALQMACRAAGEDAKARTAIASDRAKALGWPNIYTYTKALAEHSIAGRPYATIVRPSIVECARTFPFAGWNEGLNTAGPLAWLITTAYQRLPTNPDNRFDVVPVDEVARGMLLIAREMVEGRAGGVYHLASGDANPMSFGRCVELTGLAFRKWTRAGNGTKIERAVVRHLDPVPAPDARDRGIGRWPDILAAGREALEWLDGEGRKNRLLEPILDRLGDRVSMAARRVGAWETDIERIERMVDLYLPFIRDNDYRFRTDRIRAIGAIDPTVRWDVPTMDWRHYWVDVEFPGLQTWCIPILRGERIPTDPPGPTPFKLAARVAA